MMPIDFSSRKPDFPDRNEYIKFIDYLDNLTKSNNEVDEIISFSSINDIINHIDDKTGDWKEFVNKGKVSDDLRDKASKNGGILKLTPTEPLIPASYDSYGKSDFGYGSIKVDKDGYIENWFDFDTNVVGSEELDHNFNESFNNYFKKLNNFQALNEEFPKKHALLIPPSISDYKRFFSDLSEELLEDWLNKATKINLSSLEENHRSSLSQAIKLAKSMLDQKITPAAKNNIPISSPGDFSMAENYDVDFIASLINENPDNIKILSPDQA